LATSGGPARLPPVLAGHTQEEVCRGIDRKGGGRIGRQKQYGSRGAGFSELELRPEIRNPAE
jgi:hypothetical protein